MRYSPSGTCMQRQEEQTIAGGVLEIFGKKRDTIRIFYHFTNELIDGIVVKQRACDMAGLSGLASIRPAPFDIDARVRDEI